MMPIGRRLLEWVRGPLLTTTSAQYALVSMLSRRYKEAKDSRGPSREVLNAIEESSSPILLTEWKELERKARTQRCSRLDVMEPYEVAKRSSTVAHWPTHISAHTRCSAEQTRNPACNGAAGRQADQFLGRSVLVGGWPDPARTSVRL